MWHFDIGASLALYRYVSYTQGNFIEESSDYVPSRQLSLLEV
jgi:hypothetical protein